MFAKLRSAFTKEPPEGVEWLLQAYRGLLDEWGDEYFREAALVLPNDAFYPVHTARPEQAIQQVFELTVEHAGLEDWPLRLVCEDAYSEIQALSHLPGTHQGAVSSGLRFDAASEPATMLITYVRDDLSSPDGFVYQCAAQLATAALCDVQQVPGGKRRFWQYVDVAVAFMGFGIFACNASFVFQGFQDGLMEGYWCQRRGALTPGECATSLAIFAALHGIPARTVQRHLSGNPRAAFGQALKHLQQHHATDLDDLGRLRGAPVGSLSFPAADAGGLVLCDEGKSDSQTR